MTILITEQSQRYSPPLPTNLLLIDLSISFAWLILWHTSREQFRSNSKSSISSRVGQWTRSLSYMKRLELVTLRETPNTAPSRQVWTYVESIQAIQIWLLRRMDLQKFYYNQRTIIQLMRYSYITTTQCYSPLPNDTVDLAGAFQIACSR